MLAATRRNASDVAVMEIVSTRIFDAPRASVYGAFADPAELAQWWGPAGFTNTIKAFDLRPGGTWHLIMHGPDGATYDNEKHFVEVIPGERVVFDHHQPMHGFRMTITFSDAEAGTELVWRMVFQPHDENEKLKGFITAANEQNFDRLAAHLARRAR